MIPNGDLNLPQFLVRSHQYLKLALFIFRRTSFSVATMVGTMALNFSLVPMEKESLYPSLISGTYYCSSSSRGAIRYVTKTLPTFLLLKLILK